MVLPAGMPRYGLAMNTSQLASRLRSPRCRMRSLLGSVRPTGQCRFQSSTFESQTSIKAQDIQTLREEISSLKKLLQQQEISSSSPSSATYRSSQIATASKQTSDTSAAQDSMERLTTMTHNLTERTTQIELRLDQIHDNISKIGALEKLAGNAQDFLQHNSAIRGVVHNLENIVQRSRPYFTTQNKYSKYILLGVVATSAILWKYRQTMVYDRTSEEVADLARRTLEQESLRTSIQETLQTVANSQATLATLNDLVQALIAHERTQQDLVRLLVFAVNTPEVQAALLELLQVVVKDETLQQLVGEFLLKGLDTESVKTMLDAQTAELVRDTVSDDSVQQATAVGLQRSLWYSMTPSFLWRYMEKSPKESVSTEEGEERYQSRIPRSSDNSETGDSKYGGSIADDSATKPSHKDALSSQ